MILSFNFRYLFYSRNERLFSATTEVAHALSLFCDYFHIMQDAFSNLISSMNCRLDDSLKLCFQSYAAKLEIRCFSVV